MTPATTVPAHIGIIMDGNGRWAKKRNLPRTAGHKEGLGVAKSIVAQAHRLGVRYISLYTFSTENWKRAEEEISYLMNLIKTNLRREYDFYVKNDIRVIHSGDISALPREIQDEIRAVETDTSDFSGTTVNLAINYGGRNEIMRACLKALQQGLTPEQIDEQTISGCLDQSELPDLDLIIRTGGEQRLSNFMLWQSSYAELYFTDTLWPDFTPEAFSDILQWFAGRSRRYGGTS